MVAIRRKKRSRRRQRNRRRRPINVAASVLTTFSLYCGISSVFASINGEYDNAAYWIFGAMVFDILDGAVARLTNSVSEFGKELDSLSDAVSFGVAPAVLMYTGFLQDARGVNTLPDPTTSVVAISFVICAVLRLARYNVYQSSRRDYFVGLPSPAAAGTLASYVLFALYFELRLNFWILSPMTVILAVLMVSSVLYPKDRLRAVILSPRHAFQFLVMSVVGIAIFHYARQYSPAIILLPLAGSYVLFGIGMDVYLRLRRLTRKQRLAEPEEEAPGAEHKSNLRLHDASGKRETG